MTRWRSAFELYGVHFQVESNRGDLLAPVLAPLPLEQPAEAGPATCSFRLDFDAAGRPALLLVNDRPPDDELPAGAPLPWLLESLITLHVARTSEYVFVHAGLVSHRGRGILLPGRSFAGKTTLTSALLKRGAEYYSDDFAVIGPDGLAHPYHCPLRLRTSAGRIEKTAADFEACAAQRPVRPALIVATEYAPGADWQPAEVSHGEGTLRLLEHAVAARTSPEHVCRVLSLVAQRAACLTGPRGDADETARRILDCCDSIPAVIHSHSFQKELQPCCP